MVPCYYWFCRLQFVLPTIVLAQLSLLLRQCFEHSCHHCHFLSSTKPDASGQGRVWAWLVRLRAHDVNQREPIAKEVWPSLSGRQGIFHLDRHVYIPFGHLLSCFSRQNSTATRANLRAELAPCAACARNQAVLRLCTASQAMLRRAAALSATSSSAALLIKAWSCRPAQWVLGRRPQQRSPDRALSCGLQPLHLLD